MGKSLVYNVCNQDSWYKEIKVQGKNVQGYEYLGLIPCFALRISKWLQRKTYMPFNCVYTHKYK